MTDEREDALAKIHRERQSRREAADVEKRHRLERRRIFEAKCDPLWRAVSTELKVLCEAYNRGATPDAQVYFEVDPFSFVARNGESWLKLELDKAREEVSGVWSSGEVFSFRIVVSGDDLAIEGHSPRKVAEGVLFSLFREIQ